MPSMQHSNHPNSQRPWTAQEKASLPIWSRRDTSWHWKSCSRPRGATATAATPTACMSENTRNQRPVHPRRAASAASQVRPNPPSSARSQRTLLGWVEEEARRIWTIDPSPLLAATAWNIFKKDQESLLKVCLYLLLLLYKFWSNMLILKILHLVYIGSKRSHSEQDLLNMTIAGGSTDDMSNKATKTSFKNRLLTSIPGFGGGGSSSSASSSSSSSTSANHHHHHHQHHHQQQQMIENDK